MEPPICNLCKHNPATQTGSHIYSWSLIKSLVNKPGAKGRENEVVFSLSPAYVKTYIGRQQSTEDKVVPIKGRPLTEDEIRETETENPFTRDNFLCPKCEQMLSVLESLVSEKVLGDLRKHKVQNVGSYDVIAIEHGDLFRLFMYSLAWRAAVTRCNDFEMRSDHQEALRDILQKTLSQDRNTLLENIEKHKEQIRSIPVIVTFAETNGPNNNWIYCSLSMKPYALMLNDLSFQLHFADVDDDGFDPDFRGINSIIKKEDLLMVNEQELKLGVLSDDQRLRVNQRMAEEIKNEMVQNAIQHFTEGYQHFFHRAPTEAEIKLFIQNAYKRAAGKVEIFTPHDLTEAATETVRQLYPGIPEE